MTAISSQLSSLARNALSRPNQHGLPASAVVQASAQILQSRLFQDCMPCTSSAIQSSAFVHNTAVSSSGVGYHEHHEQAQSIHSTCSQGMSAWSAMPASSHTAVCLLDRLQQHGSSPYSTHWSTHTPSHSHQMLSCLPASLQHARHISSSAACWRPPHNQDSFHARALPPRPMCQAPGGGFAQNERAVPAHSLSQEPRFEQQRPPFQRSPPPHARQPGRFTFLNIYAARLRACKTVVRSCASAKAVHDTWQSLRHVRLHSMCMCLGVSPLILPSPTLVAQKQYVFALDSLLLLPCFFCEHDSDIAC